MKKKFAAWQLIGFIFVCVAGTLLHFAYEWSGESFFLALFSAVNESIFEHIKLLFFPMLIFAFIEKKVIGQAKNFFAVKLIGITFGAQLIPIIYYSYTGIFGFNSDIINIGIFFVAAAAVYYLETKLMNSGRKFVVGEKGAIALLLLMAAMFMILTFYPLRIPLFKDPLDMTYGFYKYR